jgi:hypothetical protein
MPHVFEDQVCVTPFVVAIVTSDDFPFRKESLGREGIELTYRSVKLEVFSNHMMINSAQRGQACVTESVTVELKQTSCAVKWMCRIRG